MARHRGKVHAKKHGMFGGSVCGSSSGSLIQIDAMAYGAARQYLANLISPVTSMIPLGTFADEIGIAPGVVVGRLQHDEALAYSEGNDLKVKLVWAAAAQ